MGAESSRRCFTSLSHSKKQAIFGQKRKQHVVASDNPQKLQCEQSHEQKTCQQTFTYERNHVTNDKTHLNGFNGKKNKPEVNQLIQNDMNPEDKSLEMGEFYYMIMNEFGGQVDSFIFTQQKDREQTCPPIESTKVKTSSLNPETQKSRRQPDNIRVIKK